MRFSKFIFLFLIVSFLSSCSQTFKGYNVVGVHEFVTDSYTIRQGKNAILALEGKEVCDMEEINLLEYRDEIVEGDILNIVIYHPTRKDLMESFEFINKHAGGFRVFEGRVEIPDSAPVEVIYLTLEEARNKIQDTLRESIKDAEVFVNYKERPNQKIELAGQVSIPSLPVDGKLRLFEVISRARISERSNYFMSYVLRNGHPLSVDLHKLIVKGDMSQNVVMKGGDKVFIAPAIDAAVMVMGEVGQPMNVSLPYGYMPLIEAIVTAKGIPFTGDKRNIQVIRGGMVCPKIYVVSWEHIVNLPNDSLLLMPGDTVYVSEAPITQWNRFIDQLMPSFSGILAGYEVYNIAN